MDKKITLTQALEGYELAFKSRHLSQYTLLDYQNTFRKFIAFLDDDPPPAQITPRHIEQFLAARLDADAGDPLFATSNGAPMDRDRLLKQLNNIGERAGVANVHPHRFRHTFSINYLRNGGDPWTLQMILGHATMEMVRVYLGAFRVWESA